MPTTYIAWPAICSQNLLIFVQIENLDESEAVLNFQLHVASVDGPTHDPEPLVATQQHADKIAFDRGVVLDGRFVLKRS